jgi:mycothiol system anti-sigma-R factor
MTCEEAVQKLFEYIDKELDGASAAQIDKHLDLCRLCCDRFEFENSLKKIVQKSCFNEKAPPILKQKIQDSLNELY